MFLPYGWFDWPRLVRGFFLLLCLCGVLVNDPRAAAARPASNAASGSRWRVPPSSPTQVLFRTQWPSKAPIASSSSFSHVFRNPSRLRGSLGRRLTPARSKKPHMLRARLLLRQMPLFIPLEIAAARRIASENREPRCDARVRPCNRYRALS